MLRLMMCCFILLLPFTSYALSITYTGDECKENRPFTESSGSLRTSKFEVIENAGDGDYRLRLTGGLPLFGTLNLTYCIDNGDVSLGHEAVVENDLVVTRKFENDAAAYFNNGLLVITVSSLQVTDDSLIDGNGTVFSSVVEPHSFTLIMQYQPERNSFRLLRTIHKEGVITSIGNAGGQQFLNELIFPGFEATSQTENVFSPVEYFIE